MNCQACGRDLTQYDEHRVACKGGHIWTLPEFADLPATVGPDVPAGKPMVRLVVAPTFPAWLPGAVLGALGFLTALIGLVV